jgi:hypothetical protein
MSADPSPASALVCDGCGRPAGAEHLRERILRLELQSRFRPIHIATLLLGDAPPERLEDWFYFTGTAERPRSAHAEAFFEDVIGAAGIAREGKDDAARLAEFQRRGLFLAECVECPLEQSPRAGYAELLEQLAGNLVKRIQYSYKPRRILLLSSATARVIPILEAAALAHLLLGKEPLPALPEPDDGAARASFRAHLAQRLAESASPHSV